MNADNVTFGLVNTAIILGKLDKELDALMTAVRNRKDEVNRQVKDQLKVGQTVWLNHTTRPTYLRNQECTVEQINRERIVIRMKNGPKGRFGALLNGVPMSLITTTNPQARV